MTVLLYQAKVADGIKKKGLKRMDSFFLTPEEAVSEALSLKERIDRRYGNEIQWDYNAKMTGTKDKLKILRGYLNGNRETNPFYLEIFSSEQKKNKGTIPPIIPSKVSSEDQRVIDHVTQLFA